MGAEHADTLFGGWATLPQWSPDGRYVSCVAWKSLQNPYQLTVVDVATRTVVVESSVKANGTKSEWSPDSRAIAVAGVSRGSSWVVLYTVAIPSGKSAVLDSVNVLRAHDMSWSPNGQFIAYSRPTALDEDEDAAASDLWIADVRGGRAWPLLETTGWVESNPQWITNRVIQFDRCRPESGGAKQTVVAELHNAKD
jgi:dipeptidyl aminopeptidase/acylaminoacyl peptidase